MIVTLSACSFKKLGQSLFGVKTFLQDTTYGNYVTHALNFFDPVGSESGFTQFFVLYTYGTGTFFYINEQQQNSIKDNVLTIPFIHNLQSIC